MKKLFLTIVLGLTAFSLTACKHAGKETETEAITATAPTSANDEITKEVFTDNYGDQLEATINNTRNTITIHLSGKTYELKKDEDLPEYTASNAEYQYSNIRGNITFLKKNADMVLFHYKHSKKGQPSGKMASY